MYIWSWAWGAGVLRCVPVLQELSVDERSHIRAQGEACITCSREEGSSHWVVPISLKSGCDRAGPSMGVCIFMQQSPEI